MYKITCCKCKKEILLIYEGQKFFVVQPTRLENNDWKRIKYKGFSQLILCELCIFKKKRSIFKKKR